MHDITISNLQIFSDIAENAFRQMEEHLAKGRQLRPDKQGWINTIDPDQTSFKSALIYIAFAAIWLEAVLHLQIVKHRGEAAYKKVDRGTYEKKLEVLGVGDDDLFKSLKEFRTLRRELLHEKAYFDQNNFRTAQSEARKVHAILQQVKTHLSDAKFMDG